MPSQTFFQLKQEKQQKILEAAMYEFSKELYQDASLNKIIKQANIPRGSFYMYFEDKKDLYFYLLDRYAKQFSMFVTTVIEENDGDLFLGLKKIIDIFYKDLSKRKDYNFIKNIFRSMNYFIANRLLTKKTKERLEVDIYEKVNPKYLKIKRKEEIISLIHIMIMISINSLTRIINNENDMRLIIKEYNSQIDLLEKSFYIKKG